MYQVLLVVHSYSRWLVLLTLVYAIFKALSGLMAKKEFEKSDKIAALLGLIFAHTQFVLGLVLYFQSQIVSIFWQDMGANMKNATLRFWGIEHIFTMITAIVLITVGYSVSKRKELSAQKFKFILIFYAIGLLIILSAIPWSGINARPLFRM